MAYTAAAHQGHDVVSSGKRNRQEIFNMENTGEEDDDMLSIHLHKRMNASLTLTDNTTTTSRRRRSEDFDDNNNDEPIVRKQMKRGGELELELKLPLMDLDTSTGEAGFTSSLLPAHTTSLVEKRVRPILSMGPFLAKEDEEEDDDEDEASCSAPLDYYFHSNGRRKYGRRIDYLVDKLLEGAAVRRRTEELAVTHHCADNGLPVYYPRGSHPMQDHLISTALTSTATAADIDDTTNNNSSSSNVSMSLAVIFPPSCTFGITLAASDNNDEDDDVDDNDDVEESSSSSSLSHVAREEVEKRSFIREEGVGGGGLAEDLTHQEWGIMLAARGQRDEDDDAAGVDIDIDIDCAVESAEEEMDLFG